MESKFIPTLQAGNGYTYLKLKGILDEDNLLANLLSQIQGRLLLIDMAEIDRINSCGVRDWVNWLNQIQALGIAVILLRCSPAVVSTFINAPRGNSDMGAPPMGAPPPPAVIILRRKANCKGIMRSQPPVLPILNQTHQIHML